MFPFLPYLSAMNLIALHIDRKRHLPVNGCVWKVVLSETVVGVSLHPSWREERSSPRLIIIIFLSVWVEEDEHPKENDSLWVYSPNLDESKSNRPDSLLTYPRVIGLISAELLLIYTSICDKPIRPSLIFKKWMEFYTGSFHRCFLWALLV